MWNVGNLAVTAEGGTDQIKLQVKLPFTSHRGSLWSLFMSLKKPESNQSNLPFIDINKQGITQIQNR